MVPCLGRTGFNDELVLLFVLKSLDPDLKTIELYRSPLIAPEADS